MNSQLPRNTRIVIAGGGVIGCSVAWNLAQLGCSDVVVIEKGQVGCGTTWHSAGNIIRMSTDPAAVQIFRSIGRITAMRHSKQPSLNVWESLILGENWDAGGGGFSFGSIFVGG